MHNLPLVEKSKPGVLEGTVRLSYRLEGKTHTQTATIESLPTELTTSGLHRLAAKYQLLELLDKLSSLGEGDSEEKNQLRHQIVDVSTNTNVISPYTSFVGVDPEKRGTLNLLDKH